MGIVGKLADCVSREMRPPTDLAHPPSSRFAGKQEVCHELYLLSSTGRVAAQLFLHPAGHLPRVSTLPETLCMWPEGTASWMCEAEDAGWQAITDRSFASKPQPRDQAHLTSRC